jgi:hypothetical protein
MAQRYHVETREAPDVARHPSRFRVQVKKHKLLGMVLHELLFEYRGTPQVALSRPCVYGVFGRIVGGLAPRHELCVGCRSPSRSRLQGFALEGQNMNSPGREPRVRAKRA